MKPSRPCLSSPPLPAGWKGTPQYLRLTLQGYPVTSHLFKPQIFIFTVADVAPANATMDIIATDLQALLQTKQEGDQFPFLPISNLGQLIHAQVQYMNFKSGEGVRFLTQLGQGMTLINNNELIYTFHGLTGDGKYYIAAVLPVTNLGLPASPDANGAQSTPVSNFRDYLSGLVTDLNGLPGDAFTPGLLKLDDLIRSIEVK
jgi:hypothetical protein